MTIRGLFREFVVMKAKSDEAFELATIQAYQTVRIGLMVKRTKSSVSMPSFDAVMAKTKEQSAGEMRAVLDVLAAQYGGRVRRRKKEGG